MHFWCKMRARLGDEVEKSRVISADRFWHRLCCDKFTRSKEEGREPGAQSIMKTHWVCIEMIEMIEMSRSCHHTILQQLILRRTAEDLTR